MHVGLSSSSLVDSGSSYKESSWGRDAFFDLVPFFSRVVAVFLEALIKAAPSFSTVVSKFLFAPGVSMDPSVSFVVCLSAFAAAFSVGLSSGMGLMTFLASFPASQLLFLPIVSYRIPPCSLRNYPNLY
jgi:hypothetical protein